MMTRYVATIGMFDGVHLGHQYVLRQVVEQAAQRGLQPMCITFDQPFKQDSVLTPLDEKLQLIREMGIRRVEVLAFTPELKALTAREFMEQELRDRLQVSVLLTGYDNRFGHNREEGFDDYVRYGQEMGIEVIGLQVQGSVSSSLVRQQLQKGLVSEAASLLGHPYRLTGSVTHGEHIGTALGFPTANIIPDDARQMVPASGVYAVRCKRAAGGAWHKGMMNIGTRPTFGYHPQTLEVHLLDYEGNLYGQLLTIEFVSRLRAERSFDTTEALIEQLKKDAIEAQQQ